MFYLATLFISFHTILNSVAGPEREQQEPHNFDGARSITLSGSGPNLMIKKG
jgi:hypothetical protein